MSGEKWYVVWLAALAIVVIGFMLLGYKEERECDAGGGVRLRAIWGGFHCYDKVSLRKIP